MKVYTVTYLGENYGSILQAYALQHAVRNCGAESIILKKNVLKRSMKNRVQGFLKPRENYTLFRRFIIRLQGKKYKLKKEKIHDFIDKHIITQIVNFPFETLSTLQADDILLAGSDQIWTMLDAPISDWYTFRWKGIPVGIKKYSYAASIGVSVLNDDEKKQYQEALSGFNIISFREQQAYDLLKDLFKQPVRCDLDPTLLYSGDFWKRFVGCPTEKEPYIFVYMLRPDKNLIRQSKRLAKILRCQVIYTGKMANHFFGVKTIYDAGIEDFLSYIANAEAVITNSFHGTVFSILFQKQFVSVKIASTSSRAENLLNLVGLEDRFVNDDEIVSVMDKPIDYPKALARLDTARQDSLCYIHDICQQGG